MSTKLLSQVSAGAFALSALAYIVIGKEVTYTHLFSVLGSFGFLFSLELIERLRSNSALVKQLRERVEAQDALVKEVDSKRQSFENGATEALKQVKEYVTALKVKGSSYGNLGR